MSNNNIENIACCNVIKGVKMGLILRQDELLKLRGRKEADKEGYEDKVWAFNKKLKKLMNLEEIDSDFWRSKDGIDLVRRTGLMQYLERPFSSLSEDEKLEVRIALDLPRKKKLVYLYEGKAYKVLDMTVEMVYGLPVGASLSLKCDIPKLKIKLLASGNDFSHQKVMPDGYIKITIHSDQLGEMQKGGMLSERE